MCKHVPPPPPEPEPAPEQPVEESAISAWDAFFVVAGALLFVGLVLTVILISYRRFSGVKSRSKFNVVPTYGGNPTRRKYAQRLDQIDDLSSSRQPIMVLAACPEDLELAAPMDRNGIFSDAEQIADAE